MMNVFVLTKVQAVEIALRLNAKYGDDKQRWVVMPRPPIDEWYVMKEVSNGESWLPTRTHVWINLETGLTAEEIMEDLVEGLQP